MADTCVSYVQLTTKQVIILPNVIINFNTAKSIHKKFLLILKIILTF